VQKTGAITLIDDEQRHGNINTDFNAYTTDEEGNPTLFQTAVYVSITLLTVPPFNHDT